MHGSNESESPFAPLIVNLDAAANAPGRQPMFASAAVVQVPDDCIQIHE